MYEVKGHMGGAASPQVPPVVVGGSPKVNVCLSGSELVNIAIGIEKNGAAFYDSLTGFTRNSAARATYEHMAAMEREHIKAFQEMLPAAEDLVFPETYTEEYDLYLKELIDSSVFIDEDVAREMARKASSDGEAIRIAITAEKESVLFYSEMRELVCHAEREVLDRIIDEERSHLRYLSELRKNLGQKRSAADERI